jgi:hypothetical protein
VYYNPQLQVGTALSRVLPRPRKTRVDTGDACVPIRQHRMLTTALMLFGCLR